MFPFSLVFPERWQIAGQAYLLFFVKIKCKNLEDKNLIAFNFLARKWLQIIAQNDEWCCTRFVEFYGSPNYNHRMFRTDGQRPIVGSKGLLYGLAAGFGLCVLIGSWVLSDLVGRHPSSKDVYLLAFLVLLMGLSGMGLILLHRIYRETRDRLDYVKLLSYDILQSLPIGVITTDLEGIVTNINERARELTGLEGDGVRKPLGEVFGHLAPVREPFDLLLRTGRECGGIEVSVRCGGQERTLRLEGRFLRAASGERIGTVLQIQDVTHLKFIDQEMQRTEKLAGLGTLAAGIAHEIKNPLAALHINAQLLEESIGGPAAGSKAGKYLGVIRSEIRRLQGIVDKYVSFARPRALEKAPAALETILEGILDLVGPECRKRRIEIVREGFSPDPCRYLLDEGQFQQAVLNIVINAIQAMEKGGTLTCRLGRRGDFAVVEVVDTGPGIPPEVREKIFNLFYTTRPGGTGLGLYLSQRIVSEHGGYIDVKTGSGGTTFTIAVPAAEASV